MSDAVHEPRHFWRRVFALVVDLFCASIIGALLALPLINAAPDKLQLSEGMFKLGACYEVTQLPQEVHDWIAGRPVTEAEYCVHRPNFVFPPQRRVTIKVAIPTEAGSRVNRFEVLELTVDEDGNTTSTLEIDELLAQFVLLLGSALFIMRTGATPGKHLLKLRVSGGGCALCREARRIGPFLVLGVLSLLIEVYGQTLAEPYSVSLPLILVCGAVLFGGFVAYYMVPLIRWRGAMPYDRATGFLVTMRPDMYTP